MRGRGAGRRDPHCPTLAQRGNSRRLVGGTGPRGACEAATAGTPMTFVPCRGQPCPAQEPSVADAVRGQSPGKRGLDGTAGPYALCLLPRKADVVDRAGVRPLGGGGCPSTRRPANLATPKRALLARGGWCRVSQRQLRARPPRRPAPEATRRVPGRSGAQVPPCGREDRVRGTFAAARLAPMRRTVQQVLSAPPGELWARRGQMGNREKGRLPLRTSANLAERPRETKPNAWQRGPTPSRRVRGADAGFTL
jgi:hypothetical protein